MSRYEVLSKLTNVKRNSVIMDCGCGSGMGLDYICRKLEPRELTGMDTSSKELCRCINEKEKILVSSKVVKLMLGDIRDLSQFYEYFDYFYCCETLEHLDVKDNGKAAKAIVQAIKPGGKLLISVPGHKESINNPRHKQLFNIGMLKSLFEGSCFLVEERTWQKYPNHEKKAHHHNVLAVFKKRKPLQKPRPTIKFVKEVFGDSPLVGAEIGVKAGDNATSILSELNMKRLYLVDSFEGDFAKYHRSTLKKFACSSNITILKMSSEVAAKKEVKEQLDFVYIDAKHTYENAKQDINLWYSKVKKGGIVGGHDWFKKGVKIAVEEFCREKSYSLHVGIIHKGDWYIRKGETLEDCD